MSESTSSLFGAGREFVGAHHVAHATRSILALGDASNGDVAIGDDPNQALVGPAVDDGNDSDVLATHHLGGLAHGRVGLSRNSGLWS